jgi:hypothetical protein
VASAQPTLSQQLEVIGVSKGETHSEQMIDITAPDVVEVSIREDGTVIWINVDGICKLRVCQIPNLVVDDRRIKSSVE